MSQTIYLNQTCRSGHVVKHVGYNGHTPKFNDKYRTKCRAELITACPKCKTDIKGSHTSNYTPPNYCHVCGNPFPWIEGGSKKDSR